MKAVAAVIETMRAKGLPDSDILDVVQAMVAASESGMSGGIPVDTTAERRRAYDRERKARVRWKSGGIPPEVPNPTSLSKEEIKKESKREERATRIPPDWTPDETLVQFAASHGLTARQFDMTVEKFRNYWIAKPRKEGVKLDWSATFRNWVLREVERLPVKPAALAAVKHTTTNATWVPRGSDAWAAWTRHRGKEPLCSHNGGEEGQWMPSEYPQQENAA